MQMQCNLRAALKRDDATDGSPYIGSPHVLADQGLGGLLEGVEEERERGGGLVCREQAIQEEQELLPLVAGIRWGHRAGALR